MHRDVLIDPRRDVRPDRALPPPRGIGPETDRAARQLDDVPTRVVQRGVAGGPSPPATPTYYRLANAGCGGDSTGGAGGGGGCARPRNQRGAHQFALPSNVITLG